MKTKLLLTIFIFLSVLAFGQKLPFQGKLIETGTPVTGTKTFEFEIASAEWNETHAGVQVTDGLYFVVLGSINPLPDSLFYGVEEINMSIAIDGTALSPVVLFKPLTSPFEGSDLSVKNADGTLVGTIRAKNDTVNKNGELILNGTNGNPNFTLSGTGNGGNRGYFQLHDTLGTTRANIFSTFDAGIFTLFGGNSGYLQGGFNKAAGETVTELPFLSLESNDNYLAYLSTSKYDSVYQGKLFLGSNNSASFSQNSTGFSLYKNGKQLMYATTQNWGAQGYSGYFDVRGQNSINISLGSRHWENPDLPWMKLIGSGNQDVIQLSAETDSLESGSINILSKNGNNTYLSANEISTRNNGNPYFELTSQDWGGQGPTGLFKVHGQSTQNFELTSQSWINPNFPWFKMSGDQLSDAINMYVDNDGTEAANIDLFSLGRGSSRFTTDSWTMTGPNGNQIVTFSGGGNGGNFGQFEFYNENGNTTVSLTPAGGTGLLTVFGQSAGHIKSGFKFWEGEGGEDRPFHALEGTVIPNFGLIFSHVVGDNIVEHGQIELYSTDGSKTEISASQLTFNDTEQVRTYDVNGISGTGQLSISNGVNITGDVVVNGVTEHSSDKRFKKNIQSIASNTLQKIRAIEGVSYNWRQDEFPDRNFSSDKQIGVIAQELEAQFPELVKTNADGYKSVNYNGFTAVLLEAVKELNTKVEKLEAENSRLRATISSSEKTSKEIATLQQQVQELAKLLQANQNSDILFEDITTPGLK